jgi:hypothetical protein
MIYVCKIENLAKRERSGERSSGYLIECIAVAKRIDDNSLEFTEEQFYYLRKKFMPLKDLSKYKPADKKMKEIRECCDQCPHLTGACSFMIEENPNFKTTLNPAGRLAQFMNGKT